MEIVTGIVGKVAEYAIEPAIRRVGYLTHCRSSLQNLLTQVDKLTSAREGVEHKLSRKSKKLEQFADELYQKGGFTNVSYDVHPQEVCTVSTKYYEAFDSRISTLEKIMDELRSPSSDLIVVYGIGGVGKTTLVEEVLRQAIAKKLFTDAVIVRDVKNPDLQRIQKEIAEKLGMKVDGKVLVILDDTWEKVDLETLGLPCLSNCKILLTSRNLKFLSSEMRPQKEFRLEVLNAEETWTSNALHSWIEQLKDSCLLLDNVGDEYIRMHDVMFILGCNGGDPVEIPDTFFKGMIKLKVLDLTKLDIGSLPSSLQLLENLGTLCLDSCVLGDVALVGQLTRLEILSFLNSNLKELPKEIGKLTHLRLLDLTGCYQLKVISPNVLSSLNSLEDLRMRNSFHQWVAEGVTGERSNASLLELKDLPHLAALAVHIPDASIMPRGLFSDKLKIYDISIGDTNYTVPHSPYSLTFNFRHTTRYGRWDSMDGTLNTLKLKLTTRQELDDGLRMLLKRSEALYLHGLENDFQFQSDSEDFQQLKHLYVQNIAKFTYIINEKVHRWFHVKFFLSLHHNYHPEFYRMRSSAFHYFFPVVLL
ncbi:disease resistance protein [Pyrus ussuriensis x Pyrus communis]|uniref:Disease resistance protein n=1 Tax=Pyrus ussuriensis x Pyrus communis TaxID=2448454 RepID=A0A5N5GV67_9ROSA|nr:disease resistance protein [Pyrus ussuriensis x Pyrus communis]